MKFIFLSDLIISLYNILSFKVLYISLNLKSVIKNIIFSFSLQKPVLSQNLFIKLSLMFSFAFVCI